VECHIWAKALLLQGQCLWVAVAQVEFEDSWQRYPSNEVLAKHSR
jgi:hypothetical protein